MKPTLKLNFRSLLFLPLLFLMLITSCQKEEVEITNPEEEELVVANSNLASLMLRTATNDGSNDNIIDYANCLEVELPVTVVINDLEIIIDSETDFETLETIFNEFDNDNDQLEIVFPITIILSDYTEIVIENQEALNVLIAECNGENEEDDDIECIDFQYPISVSIYNSSFQVLETVVIYNDEALFNFIENLEGGVLASLDFPINLVLANGEVVVVNNNNELETAIAEAEDDCDEDDDYDWNDDNCSEEAIELALKECVWELTAYSSFPEFVGLVLQFNSDFSFEIIENGQVIGDNASWSVSESNTTFVLTLLTDFEDLAGDWIIENCNDQDEFNFINSQTQETMQLEQDCDDNTNPNPFECFGDFVIEACELDTTNPVIDAIFNLNENTIGLVDCQYYFLATFHETITDAENNTNAIANTEAYQSISKTIYLRIEAENSEFEIFEIQLIVEDCTNNSGCTEAEVNAYLLECQWNVVNYNGSDDLIVWNFDFESNGIVVIYTPTNTIDASWYTTQTNDGILLNFSGVNAANIQVVSGSWLVVECDSDRLQMVQNQDMMVMEQACNTNDTCTEAEVENNLLDCEWTISSYNNDSGFNIFNIDFQNNNEAVIFTPNGNEEYTANWTVSLDGEIYLDFSNISGGNTQVLEGNFILVECTPNQMIFHDPSNSNIELVLDKDCG